MKLQKKVVIVIIAHKESLSNAEKLSLKQCYKILGKYPIKIICPEGLDVSEYLEINSKAEIVFIDARWQSTYQMFNKLKIDSLLYIKFKDYENILFYELDAWVFRNELEYWCDKEYDYVGAPWFEGWGKTTSDKIIGVGNGGFSLRNIQSSIRILRRVEFLKRIRIFWFKSYLQVIFPFHKLISFFKKYFKIRSKRLMESSLFEYSMHEDYYWAHIIAETFSDYKVATVEDALKFSFENNPEYLYKKNDYQLPFGCHAWEKYDLEFWSQYIPD